MAFNNRFKKWMIECYVSSVVDALTKLQLNATFHTVSRKIKILEQKARWSREPLHQIDLSDEAYKLVN